MKKLLFAAGAMIIAAAVSAAVCLTCGQTRHNDLFEQNLDALARGEGDEKYFFIAKYDIASMFKVVRVSGQANIQVGALLTMTQLDAMVSGEVEGYFLDCHYRHCCSTTEKQNIECIEGSGWEVCHSQCDHSNNQM